MARTFAFAWFKAAKGYLNGASKSGRAGRRPRPARFAPALEALEERTVPSTFEVTNTHDGGAGSLRQAVLDANAHPGADLIAFAPRLSGTITLTGGQLTVTDALTVSGPGADRLTVSGNNASRVFDIGAGQTVTIAGLRIADGSAGSPGSTGSGDGGGGIANEAGATLTLLNTTVANNRAFGIGGGLWNHIGATATVINSNFVGNKALGSINFNYPDEGFSPGNGTAEGGAIDNDGTAAVFNSAFTDNLAEGAAGGSNSSGHGGAIGSDGPLTVTASAFTGNRALGARVTSAANNSSEGIGGALIAFDVTTISNSTFTGNEAAGGAGGTGYVFGPPPGFAFVSSYRGIGGAIAMQGATASVTGSTFDHNQAVGGAGRPGSPGSLGIGGGLDAVGSSLTLSNSSVSHNAAVGGAGANSAHPWDGAGVGGGLSVDLSSTASMTGITVDHNQALGGEGTTGANGGNAFGAGISIGSRSIWGRADGTSVTLSDSTIAHNLALGGDGGAGGNGGNGSGGGVFIGGTVSGRTPSLTVTASAITKNTADGGDGSGGGADGLGKGGGVYDLGTFNAVFTVIAKNHASTSNDNFFP